MIGVSAHRKRKRIGGVPLAMSSVYKILSNPFYAGIIEWGGQTYPGKHEPVVSIDEFQRVRQLLDRPGRPRKRTHTFAFTGLIHCGACNLMVTAENKTNRYGDHYVYYHCSKRKLGSRCPEPSIEIRALEEQIGNFLPSIQIDPAIEAWVLDEIARKAGHVRDYAQARSVASFWSAIKDVEEQIDELTGLRIRRMITDDQFLSRRTALQQEQLRLRQKAAVDENSAEWFEPAKEIVSFSCRAAEWFVRGDEPSKRLILDRSVRTSS